MYIDNNLKLRRDSRKRVNTIKRKERVVKSSFGTKLEDYKNGYKGNYEHERDGKNKVDCNCKNLEVKSDDVENNHDFVESKIDKYV